MAGRVSACCTHLLLLQLLLPPPLLLLLLLLSCSSALCWRDKPAVLLPSPSAPTPPQSSSCVNVQARAQLLPTPYHSQRLEGAALRSTLLEARPEAVPARGNLPGGIAHSAQEPKVGGQHHAGTGSRGKGCTPPAVHGMCCGGLTPAPGDPHHASCMQAKKMGFAHRRSRHCGTTLCNDIAALPMGIQLVRVDGDERGRISDCDGKPNATIGCVHLVPSGVDQAAPPTTSPEGRIS